MLVHARGRFLTATVIALRPLGCAVGSLHPQAWYFATATPPALCYAIVKSVLVLWQILAQVAGDGCAWLLQDGYKVHCNCLRGPLENALV